MPADCPCHGLPRAPNRQCILRRRESQARYQQTAKGKAVKRRHYAGKGKLTQSIYQAEKTIRRYTPGTPEYAENYERVMSKWTN